MVLEVAGFLCVEMGMRIARRGSSATTLEALLLPLATAILLVLQVVSFPHAAMVTRTPSPESNAILEAPTHPHAMAVMPALCAVMLLHVAMATGTPRQENNAILEASTHPHAMAKTQAP